jgi:glycosyltransferase EpsD
VGSVSPVVPYLLISDLYVSASTCEGLPFNIMEAMSCGLPIVASDVKGQNDLLYDYPQTLYPLNDENAFCDAVRRAYCATTHGAYSRRYPTIEKYRLSKVFEETMRLFSSGIPKKESTIR